MTSIKVRFYDDVPVKSYLSNGMIVTILDDNNCPLKFILNRQSVEDLREQLQVANEEKTNEAYEDEILMLEAKIEELQDFIELKEELENE